MRKKVMTKNPAPNPWSLAPCLLALIFASAQAADPVMLQDFEKAGAPSKVWVVNMPNENASAELSRKVRRDGNQALRLQYKFTEGEAFQYLGVPLGVKIKAPVEKVRFWMRGDGSRCSCGVQITDAGGETHQFSKNGAARETVDFTDWKEVVIDTGDGHETWGGDKNGKIDYPVENVTVTLGQPTEGSTHQAAEGEIFIDSLSVDPGMNATDLVNAEVAVTSPAYCSDIKVDTKIVLSAPGFKKLTAKCWRQGQGLGGDSTVATIPLDAQGAGSFVFPADRYPHGPITIRISGSTAKAQDNCYLQLYNKGGVSWNEGLPAAPPQTAGMKLVFEDDFKGPLSIGSDSSRRYYDHKPPSGSEDFSFPMRFRNFDSPENPFSQVDTYLRIRADASKESAGLISSLHGDGSGFKAAIPCYFECRFIAPNAPGTWPAFWLMNDYFVPPVSKLTDELDIIEAYGGEGPKNPNAYDKYIITPHAWNYPPKEEAEVKEMLKKKWPYPYLVSMQKLHVPSAWYEASHTYGCMVTEKETTYYLDNVKIGSHPTLPMCKERPLFFMVNLATGGGWPVDLSRYNGVVDMYVDFVRVYQGDPAKQAGR